MRSMANLDQEDLLKTRPVDNLCTYSSQVTVLQQIQHLQDELALISEVQQKNDIAGDAQENALNAAQCCCCVNKYHLYKPV